MSLYGQYHRLGPSVPFLFMVYSFDFLLFEFPFCTKKVDILDDNTSLYLFSKTSVKKMLVQEMNNTLEQILQILDGFSQDWTLSASGKYAQANFAYMDTYAS